MNKQYNITRFPKTSDRSLKAWSAADEYMIQHAATLSIEPESIAIYNDRFGYLSMHLTHHYPKIITHYRSQEDAILNNADRYNLDLEKDLYHPLEKLNTKLNHVFLKVPKSMELFRLFLVHMSDSLTDDAVVVCGFMTKYFTKQMLEIAGDYFETIDQSLAWKKSRLLILSNPKKTGPKDIKNIIEYISPSEKKYSIVQYYGVFSAKHIDYATQFLLEHIELDANVTKVLDLASGNGIIAHQINEMKPGCEIHLSDDSYLALASSKLNCLGSNFHFHYDCNLNKIDDSDFDLVVSNPPFHFEHENTIDIAIGLFQDAHRVLREDGRFICVANIHLNYKTHLTKVFDQVDVVDMNSKFIVYECWK